MSSGWPAARPSADSTDLANSAGSSWANRPLSGPSTSLASAPACHAVSRALIYFLPSRWPLPVSLLALWGGPGSARSCPLEDRGDALAAADAHRDQGVPAVRPAQFVQGLDGQDGAG